MSRCSLDVAGGPSGATLSPTGLYGLIFRAEVHLSGCNDDSAGLRAQELRGRCATVGGHCANRRERVLNDEHCTAHLITPTRCRAVEEHKLAEALKLSTQHVKQEVWRSAAMRQARVLAWCSHGPHAHKTTADKAPDTPLRPP